MPGGACGGPGAGGADAARLRLQEAPRLLPRVPWLAVGSPGAMGSRGPRRGAGWGAPPLLSAQTAFALGRGELHWLLSPSRDSWRVPAVGGVCGLTRAGQWAGASAVRGDTGPAPCPPSLVGVCGACRGPGTTGRNRFDWPGEELSRSAGVEPAWLTPGCRRPTQPPGVGGGPDAVGRSRALASACEGCPASLCRVTSGGQS